MKTKHLSEKEIQQYVLNKINCEIKIIEHVGLCEDCQEKAGIYEALFAEVKASPKPVFDFDLSTLVLNQMAQPKPKFSWLDSLVYLAAFTGIIFVSIVVYSLKNYVEMIFSGLSIMIVLLISITALTILVLLSIEAYKKNQILINKLDFY